MKFRNILTMSALCMTLISPTFSHFNNVSAIQAPPAVATVNTLKASSEESSFSISNQALATKMMTLLGKQENKFTSSDIINHENYKVIKTEISPGDGIAIDPIYAISTNTNYLNLSNSNITDITELCQFTWPETLIGIDLSGNNIKNENIPKLLEFLTYNSSMPDISIEEKTLKVKSDISSTLEIINLNNNAIDLSNIPVENLGNPKILYGFQKIQEGVFNKNELQTSYYIKNSDLAYIDFTAKLNNEYIVLNKNSVNKLSDIGYGDFEINMISIPECAIAPFEKKFGLSHFNMYIKDTFSVERKTLFAISKDDVVVEGLSEGFTITPFNTSTKNVGTNYVNITFTTNSKSWTTPLLFNITDTTKPTLRLRGGETIYLAINKQAYKEYGCIGMDSGDDISHNVQISGRVDITKAGDYTITYTLKDEAGNEAIPVTRKVVVQAYSLQNVKIGSLNENFYTNEEIILTASLPTGADIKKYKHLSYTWYYNDQEFITTSGDKVTGTSSLPILESDTKTIKIHVVLTATLNDGSTESYTSDPMNITIKKNTTITTTIVLITLLVIMIIAVVVIVLIVEKKKSKTHKKGGKKKSSNKKGSTKKSGKKKEQSKPAHDNYDNIQVIKDYKGSNDDPPSKLDM